MNILIQDLHGIAPLPWRAERIHDEMGWAHRVVDADGKCLGERLVYPDQNALMVAVHAFGPEALDYVLRAAERGGKEAIDLADRFKASLVSARENLTAPAVRKR